MNLGIRDMSEADWPAVRAIYQEGIATGQATFETDVPEWTDWDRAHLPVARFVAEVEGKVVGWAALSPVSDRCAYAGVAEVSIYTAAAARGRGVGRRLMTALLAAAEAAGIWTVQAGIFTDNAASVALATSAGFRLVGKRERIGRLNGEWRDVLLMERRSQMVGVSAARSAQALRTSPHERLQRETGLRLRHVLGRDLARSAFRAVAGRESI
jgi:phosphinothricin acetyltransferase